MNHHAAVVQEELALGEARLAESRTRGDFVDDGAVGTLQTGGDQIEIAIAPRPEMQAADVLLNVDGAALSGL